MRWPAIRTKQRPFSRVSRLRCVSATFAGSMCLAFTQASEKRNKPSPGLRRLIEIVLIECPSSGWIPDSTRCAGIRVSTTCYVASVFRCKLRFGWTGTPQNVRGGCGNSRHFLDAYFDPKVSSVVSPPPNRPVSGLDNRCSNRIGNVLAQAGPVLRSQLVQAVSFQ
jgi:hypothetical protein